MSLLGLKTMKGTHTRIMNLCLYLNIAVMINNILLKLNNIRSKKKLHILGYILDTVISMQVDYTLFLDLKLAKVTRTTMETGNFKLLGKCEKCIFMLTYKGLAN